MRLSWKLLYIKKTIMELDTFFKLRLTLCDLTEEWLLGVPPLWIYPTPPPFCDQFLLCISRSKNF